MAANKALASKKRNVVDVGTKVDVIHEIRSGARNAEISKSYGLLTCTVSTILKVTKKIMEWANLKSS